ncbi:MAG: class I SAM-dependent methyltransferase [Pseudomonadota bacterium]
MNVRAQFDESYYQRYYLDARTRVAEPHYFEDLAQFLGAYLKLLDVEVTRILDIGCGLGLLHKALSKTFVASSITGIEASEYAANRFGWQHCRIEDYENRDPFDVVICYDVVQYLDNKAAAAAIEKIAGLTKSALFFGVLTTEDWQDNCDQSLTDGAVFQRKTTWYRNHLRQHFINAGGGLFVKKDANVTLYSLESCV